MLRIYVDEAAAFDMLSILQLKAVRIPKELSKYSAFMENMREQLGPIIVSIMVSDEYAALLEANAKVFNYITEIDQGESLEARIVHEANMERFYAKRSLQNKFFGSELDEEKTVK